MHSKLIAISLVTTLALAAAPGDAEARAVRVDSGNWDNSGFLSTGSSQSIGFNVDFLGVSASTATISENGFITLAGGGQSAQINAFGDLNQSGGNTAQYQFGVTNGNFNAAGVDAGFRVSWQVRDAQGALLNEYQLSLFSLSTGQLALEFNYNQLLFGDNSSQVGYSTSLGDSLDLLDVLGLNFADYSGLGDDGFTNNCGPTPNALACNNYYDGTYGPNLSVLPEIANGFFRQIDSNGDDVQGRALFVFGAAQIPEPGTVALFALGLALLLLSRRHIRQRVFSPSNNRPA